jgi:hypothetical protein
VLNPSHPSLIGEGFSRTGSKPNHSPQARTENDLLSQQRSCSAWCAEPDVALAHRARPARSRQLRSRRAPLVTTNPTAEYTCPDGAHHQCVRGTELAARDPHCHRPLPALPPRHVHGIGPRDHVTLGHPARALPATDRDTTTTINSYVLTDPTGLSRDRRRGVPVGAARPRRMRATRTLRRPTTGTAGSANTRHPPMGRHPMHHLPRHRPMRRSRHRNPRTPRRLGRARPHRKGRHG